MVITIGGVTYGEKEHEEECREAGKALQPLLEKLKALGPLPPITLPEKEGGRDAGHQSRHS